MEALKSLLRPFVYRMRGLPLLDRDGIKAEHLREILTRDDPLILEIGANDGEHTEWMLGLFPRCEIHCFEPEPRAATRFRERMRGRSNVFLHPIALGNEVGFAKFYRSSTGSLAPGEFPTGWDGSGSLRPPSGHLQRHPEITFDHVAEVEVQKLDNWICSLPGERRIDFVWMDVQGAEADVLLGAANTLGRISAIYTEYSNIELFAGQRPLCELRRMLSDFRVHRLFPDDVLFVRKDPA